MADLLRFATTSYFGYDRHGGVEGLAALANPAMQRWVDRGELPETVSTVRACLFFESRRWHHLGRPLDADAERYVRALAGRLRALTGGSVAVDRDGLHWLARRWLRERFASRRRHPA